uniref:Uncharacterized protein n=1 Tax=Quercus lobata TaxID=97700 RepID=A0A7N2N7Y9_QUELO
MGRFEKLVNTPAAMEVFRAKYRIPPGVGLRYCPLEGIVTDKRLGEVVIPMIAFIEGGMTLPMRRITREYLFNYRLAPQQCAPNMFKILGCVDVLDERMNLGLTWHDVAYLYECHRLGDEGYYLKSRNEDVRLISCLPVSNKTVKNDFLIASGEWFDGIHCPTRAGNPDKSHVAPRLSLVNVPALNYLLRSEIYVSEDGQLRAAHLVLGYQPLSSSFQAIGHAIRAGSPRLARIDVSRDGFLADHDLPPVVLPGVRNPYLAEQLPPPDEPGVAVQVEEEAESSRLSLEEEIDEFHFEEEVQQSPLAEFSDPEGERDRHSAVGAPSLVICSDDTSDEETEPMAGKGKTLKELLGSRGKGQSSKGPPSPQAKALPPVVPQGTLEPGLKVNPDLKKKRPVDTPEEGEVAAQPTKQQKTARAPRSRRGNSSESRDEESLADVRVTPRVFFLFLYWGGSNPIVRVGEGSICFYPKYAILHHTMSLKVKSI